MVDPFSSLAGLLTIIQMTVMASEQAKSHKHNVQSLARRIKLLIPLIQEVKEREMTQGQRDSFENLQIAIERARDLIVKCGERSKMYMMFRGTGIIEKFKDVSLDLDRCLNALPLVNLKVSEEIRGQVDSVSAQLRKAKYTIDEMDQKLSSDIALVLKEQREGLEANQALMRQLAEKLELNSHDKVLAEARALEREKEEVRAEKDRQEEAYITQIINLLSVMDTTQDRSEAGPSGAQEVSQARSSSLRLKAPPVAPEEFRCPISLELMADPVVIASGQTFDRACIQKWLNEGHRTCPITRTPLNNLELISNFSLKRMISDWCDNHGLPQPVPPDLNPAMSPSGRIMTEITSPFGKPSPEEEEKWPHSGPMTVPDRGKAADTSESHGKGKQVVTLSDMGGDGGQKVGFEHFHAPPVAIAYDQHERLPSEFGRVSLDEEVISGEVRGDYSPHAPSPSSAPPAKPLSRRTFRSSLPAASDPHHRESSSSQRASVNGSEEVFEERERLRGMPQSLSSEFKPPRPARGVEKGDPSQPGHRRNSSAPLSEVAGIETAQANGIAPSGHHGSSVSRVTLHSKHSVPPPPQATTHGSGNETEDLSGVNFAPPPPPRAQAKPASAPFPFERPMHHANSLPTRLEVEEPGHCTKLEGSEQISSTPKFAPMSPIRSEYPVAVTSSGHAVRSHSLIPPKFLAETREPLADPKRPVSPGELQSMTRELKSGSLELVRAATGDLRLLAKYSMENRAAIASAGIIPDLIGLLLSKDAKTQENAVTALLNLSIHDGNKATIARDGAIPRLVEVLQGGSQEAKENAAATLFSLSVLEECKLQIGAQAGAIVGLVDLLRTGSALGKKDATTALFNLSICHENKSRIVRNGAVGPLIQLIKDPNLQEKVVAVLANLTTIGEGRLAITEAWGIKALVAVTERGTPRSKENAAAALLQLCINSSRHTAEIYQEGVVPSLMSLQQTGTGRAKEKAKALLRHFRDNLQDTVKP